MYKIKYEAALELHKDILENKKVYSDDRLTKFEWMTLGFDLTKVQI
jgi:hypothetical protein